MPKDPSHDAVIIQLSSKDAICLRDCVEGGVLISGSVGVGKRGMCGRALAKAILRSGGGLVLTAKSDGTENPALTPKQ